MSNLTFTDDALTLAVVDAARMKITQVHLEDKTEDTVELKSVVDELLAYINQKIESGEENHFVRQILPLVAQTAVIAMNRFLGGNIAAAYMTNPTTRTTLVHMMCTSLLLLKFIQQKELTIVVSEEDISQEDFDRLQRKSTASSAISLAIAAGVDPLEVLRELKDKGEITDEELPELDPGVD